MLSPRPDLLPLRPVAFWWRFAVILLVGGAGVSPCLRADPADSPPRSERQVKAAYIYNFGRFIAWPEASRRSTPGPFKIGVLGDDLLADELASLLSDRSIRDHVIEVVRIRTPEDLLPLRILVIGEIDLTRWAPALNTLRDRPVLIVGSAPDFARATGHIGFYVADQRVRFAINPATLRRSNLQASSRLLSLALVVDTDPVTASPAP